MIIHHGKKAFEIRGYTDEEIAKCENDLNISFPSAYVDYLRVIGRSGFTPFLSYSIELKELKKNLKWFEERIKSNRKVFIEELRRPICVFLYDFAGGYKYFFCDETKNPQVFCSDEREMRYFTNYRFFEYLMFEIKQLDQ
jgi:hypothetical protein